VSHLFNRIQNIKKLLTVEKWISFFRLFGEWNRKNECRTETERNTKSQELIKKMQNLKRIVKPIKSSSMSRIGRFNSGLGGGNQSFQGKVKVREERLATKVRFGLNVVN
jgi:hypothetical protein